MFGSGAGGRRRTAEAGEKLPNDPQAVMTRQEGSSAANASRN